MRTLRLLEVAAQAERLRLRAMLQRNLIRLAWAVGSAMFVAATIVCGHVAAIAAMSERLTLAQASGLVALADLVIAVILAVVVSHSRISAGERAALTLRRDAMSGIGSGLSWAALLPILFGLLRRRYF